MFKGLWVKNFRNFSEASVSLSPNVNILIGDNGQGKTNLIEALYILSRGQSFRYSENANLIKTEEQGAVLKVKAVQSNLEYEVQTQILKSKKNIFLNGKKVTTSEITKRFPIVLFSPESLSAIKEGADERRLLVDDLIISLNPQATDLIADYKKALKTRNRILKNYLEGLSDKHQTQSVLESLDPIYLKLAADLTWTRLKALNEIKDSFNEIMQNISKTPHVDISVEYVSSSTNILSWSPTQITDLLKKRLFELRDAELSSGASLVGPHKQDINFLYNGNNSRFFCSQGQQRAMILSFKMAQIVYHRRVHGNYPVLLLDDVMSELDLEKRGALLVFLEKIDSQIFITTTDLSLPQDSFFQKSSVIKVKEGRILEGQ